MSAERSGDEAAPDLARVAVAEAGWVGFELVPERDGRTDAVLKVVVPETSKGDDFGRRPAAEAVFQTCRGGPSLRVPLRGLTTEICLRDCQKGDGFI
jgi:hypothetical protein